MDNEFLLQEKETCQVSIILPTYNEKDNIVSLIETIHDELRNYNHEIIVVDDNSLDGTYQAVVGLNRHCVKAILRSEKPGLANSIRCGLENAKGSILVIMDSDFNHQPKYLPFMINALAHYECVSGSRFIYGGKMHNELRHMLSWIFNIFVRLMTGGLITDNLYGFLAIKRKVIERCNYDDIFWGYGDYCIRLMYCLQKHKVRILQIPVVNGLRTKGEANTKFFKVFCQYFKEVIKLAYRIRIKYYDARN